MEHFRVVGINRHPHPACNKHPDGVCRYRWVDIGSYIRQRTTLQGKIVRDIILYQRRVFDGPAGMANAFWQEGVDGTPDARRTGCLAGVDRCVQAVAPRQRKHRCEWFGWV